MLARRAVFLVLASLHCYDAFSPPPVSMYLPSKRFASQNMRSISMHAEAQNLVEILSSGVRISRIISVSTDKFDAMMKLSRAKTRSEIMSIALIRHKKNCLILDHQQLPFLSGDVYDGWGFEPRRDSFMRTRSGTPASSLWIIDDESNEDIEVKVGSWLLASLTYQETPERMSALFSRDANRSHKGAQAVALTQPGAGAIRLVQTPESLQWIATYIELEYCDELGMPMKRPRAIGGAYGQI
jgi:hypothetical protein